MKDLKRTITHIFNSSIQRNEILRDVLNGKLKIVQNKRMESDSESDEGEIEDEGSDFEIHDTSDGTVATDQSQPPQVELNIHTYGEIIKCDTKTKCNNRKRKS